MKMIKVDDDVHAILKRSGNIRQAVRELVLGRADLEVVLDEVKLIHKALDDVREMAVKNGDYWFRKVMGSKEDEVQ